MGARDMGGEKSGQLTPELRPEGEKGSKNKENGESKLL